jgi:Uma2 family endonuclease
MGRVATLSKVSVEDYLAWERQQEGKHEYYEGEIYAMAGGSPRHNALSARMVAALGAALGAKCHVLTSDQRIRARTRRYVYADASVVCGPLAVEHDDVLTNPAVIIEVLSSSTEQYDRGAKWESYQSLSSLTDYVLVSQDRARVEHFGRSDARWLYTAHDAGQTLELTNGARIDVDAVFAGVFELPGDPLANVGGELP